MAKEKLRDPVEDAAIKTMTDADIAEQLENYEPSSIQPQHVKISNPFDGYDVQYLGKGKGRINLTQMVLYNHIAKPIRQNPNLRPVKDKKTGEVRTPITAHSRAIRDYDEKQNTEVVFDRGPVKTKKGTFYYALVPNHYVRAQCAFHYNTKSGAIENDVRYLLMDGNQINRLLRCFQMVINPKLKLEKQASFISGESQMDPGDMPEPASEE